jgi:hypothetical protein
MPTADELRTVIAAHLADPSQQASAASIARVVRNLLIHGADEAELCGEDGCPHARVEGLDSCSEHTAQDLATLRRQVREAALRDD